LCLAGDLDLSTVAILQGALDGAEARSPAALVLDLSSLSFMDSTGLHCIAQAHERAQRAGRRLILVPGASCVERVVELTGLDKQLEFVTPVALQELLSTGPTVAV
jgi:anti-sigma B factor antagonist